MHLRHYDTQVHKRLSDQLVPGGPWHPVSARMVAIPIPKLWSRLARCTSGGLSLHELTSAASAPPIDLASQLRRTCNPGLSFYLRARPPLGTIMLAALEVSF